MHVFDIREALQSAVHVTCISQIVKSHCLLVYTIVLSYFLIKRIALLHFENVSWPSVVIIEHFDVN